MKSFILLCTLSVGLLFAASTTAKIKDSKKVLSATSTDKTKTHRRLGKIAKDIQAAEKDIVYLEAKIASLEESQNKSEKQYATLKSELSTFEKEFSVTSAELKKKRETFIALLSEQFSVVFALEQAHEPTQDSIILNEVYKAYKNENAKILARLGKEITGLKKRQKSKLYLRNKTKKEIAAIVKKRERFAAQKKAKQKLLKKLSQDEDKYNTKLVKIVDKQNALRSTLAKLNILHAQEVEVARKKAAAKKEAMRLEKERQRKVREAKALARKKARQAKEALRLAKNEAERAKAKKAVKAAVKAQKVVYKKSAKVRQVNTSYTKSKTYNYRGGKTISPLAGARVIKKFGTYVDPIYKIKIFNESVTLKAASSNAKVRNILNGKVVFAGKSSMLGKVVVVSHSKKIHTVYAGLSKIAPTIHVGSKIKRGYTIGKVNEKLVFQATKNSKHINPLRLIKL